LLIRAAPHSQMQANNPTKKRSLWTAPHVYDTVTGEDEDGPFSREILSCRLVQALRKNGRITDVPRSIVATEHIVTIRPARDAEAGPLFFLFSVTVK
jgi:hypothetical protein